jgi:tetratricopeptide (TPR) repeat protein
MLKQSDNPKAKSKRGLANAHLLKDAAQSQEDAKRQLNAYLDRTLSVELFFHDSRTQQVFEDLKEAMNKEPENVEHHLDFAEALYALCPYDDRKEIIKVYDKILKTFDKSQSKTATLKNVGLEKIYAKRGKFYAMCDDFDNAVNDLNEAMGLHHGNSDYLYYEIALVHQSKGNINSSKKEHELSESYIGSAIQLNPNKSKYYYVRGTCRLNIAKEAKNPSYQDALVDMKYQEALNDFNKAISINPNVASYYEKRADVLGQLGKLKEAITDYDSFIKLSNSKSYVDYNQRGNLKEQIGDWKGAAEDYEKGVELGAQKGFYELAARCKQKSGDINGAINLMDKYIAAERFGIRWLDYEKRSEMKKAVGDYSGARKDAFLSWLSRITP